MSYSFAKQGIHPVFQMMCTTANHMFLGVCTNKKIAQKSSKNNIKSEHCNLYKQQDCSLTINNTLEKRLPHGLTYLIIETA